jgi:hypothetical protein
MIKFLKKRHVFYIRSVQSLFISPVCALKKGCTDNQLTLAFQDGVKKSSEEGSSSDGSLRRAYPLPIKLKSDIIVPDPEGPAPPREKLMPLVSALQQVGFLSC